jgi:hypothetical protein
MVKNTPLEVIKPAKHCSKLEIRKSKLGGTKWQRRLPSPVILSPSADGRKISAVAFQVHAAFDELQRCFTAHSRTGPTSTSKRKSSIGTRQSAIKWLLGVFPAA